jgi:hypothetical protein
MPKKRSHGKKKRGGMYRRRGGNTNKILSGIKSYKKVAGALGVRKGLASLGKLAIGTGLRVAKGRAAMLR